MSGAVRSWIRARVWWISFVVLLAVALLFSAVVGNYVARLRVPVEVGSSAIGEWADLSEYGFRARLDSMDVATSFPRSFDAGERQTAQPGTTYLRVRMSIEPLVDPDGDMACRWELFNGAGEQLTMTEYGIDGPESMTCSFLEADGTRERGVPFASQEVYVVVPDDAASYSLRLQPDFTKDRVYWTFTVS